MASEKVIVANWKASLLQPAAEKWLRDFSAAYTPLPGIRVVLAMPYPLLVALKQQVDRLPGVSAAAQDVSPFPPGRYTGSVPAAMLRGLADYVLVGHRERRKYFHETIQDVANKVAEALDADILPIVCVDMETARRQAASLEVEVMERIYVACTPDDAEQLETAPRTSTVTDYVERVAALFPGAPVLYGGGVNAENVGALASVPNLAGVMAASGCLDPVSFVGLLRNAAAVWGG
ncbi:MAG: triose-phosphate isomerase [Desulfobulbaceae bacterium]